MLANFWKYQAIWICSSPFDIAPYLAWSSRVWISGPGCFIIRLIGAFVRGISLDRESLTALAFRTRYWGTSYLALFGNLSCCLMPYRLLEHFFEMHPHTFLEFRACLYEVIMMAAMIRRVVSEIPRLTIDNRLVNNMLCNFGLNLCYIWLIPWHFAAAYVLFQAGSHFHSSCWSPVHCIPKASGSFFVPWQVLNQLITSIWWWISSRQFCIDLIVASVWYQYSAIRWRYTSFLACHRASVM